MRKALTRLTLIQQVRALRGAGNTFSEIQHALGREISKSTLSYWCRTVQLPRSYRERIRGIIRENATRARVIAVRNNRLAQINFLKTLDGAAARIVAGASDNTLKIALAMLYLGEGAKWQSYRGLKLGSSDPMIIKLYMHLLKTCFGIDRNQLRLRIQYRADQDIGMLQDYWSKITNIHASNFYKTKPDSRTLGKPTKKRDYRGVCVVSCSGSHIQLELAAIANNLQREILGR